MEIINNTNILREQLALWTFETDPTFEDGVPISADKAIVTPRPFLSIHNQNIVEDGRTGFFHIDREGMEHPGGRALVWDRIGGKGESAKMHLTLSTIGWERLGLRFDYYSFSSEGFDVFYRVNNSGKWKLLVESEELVDDHRWHSLYVNLEEFIELADQELVTLRLDNFNRTGKKRLAFDNIELSGVRTVDNKYPPAITGLPIGVSTVINDPLQPDYTGTNGFIFHVSDPVTPLRDLQLSVTCADTRIIEEAWITSLHPNSGVHRLEIGTPAGMVGVTSINVTVTNRHNRSSTVTVQYGASAFPEHHTPLYFTGSSNASAAVPIDDDWMLVGDDESNVIRVYPKHYPSPPVREIFVQPNRKNQPPLYLPDARRSGELRELDMEDGFKLHNRAYWMCSHSNNGVGKIRPNRHRLFVTDIHGTGASVELRIIGYYDGLRRDLTAWGDHWGYDFTAATKKGQTSKAINGFNIEGFCLAPDGLTAFIGFRAPLVPNEDRRFGLIAPILNFTQWFNNGNPVTAAPLAPPIELDLGGRGIRAIKASPHGCLIVAGPFDDNGTFALFTWTGHPEDVPVQHEANLDGMRPEVIVTMPEGALTPDTEIQILSDNGTADWYETGQQSKEFVYPLQKFRSDVVRLGQPVETTYVLD